MKILLDTHVCLFLFADDCRLGAHAKALVSDATNDCYVSVASMWEVAIKNAKDSDKMPFAVGDFIGLCARAGYIELPVRSTHVRALRLVDRDPLAPVHGDPFDRILLTQACADSMHLLTADRKLLAYGHPFVIEARH